MKVTLNKVSKQFKTKRGTVNAVQDLSVTIESGKLIGFLGPSGCGKSTTLYMLAGIYQASGGKILFDDCDVSSLPPEQRNIGMVFQNYALYPHLTVGENIAFPLVNAPHQKKAILRQIKEQGNSVSFKQYVKQRVEEVSALVEISAYLDRKPAELSGGQQQRVAIARALVKRPQLLLLDEPLSNLDARLRLQTREEIRRIQKETGITTVFVTHDQEEALNICDEIVIMRDGFLQQQGTPQEVYESPENLFVAKFLGTPPINILSGEIRSGQLQIADRAWRSIPHIDISGKVTIGVRAENLFITDQSSAETLPAVVTAVNRLGGAGTVTAALTDGQSVKLFCTSQDPVSIGDTIQLAAAPKSVCLFDETGKKVLQW